MVTSNFGANGTAVDLTGPQAHVWILARIVGLYPANPAFELNVTEVPAGANVTLTLRNDDLNPLGKHDWHLVDVEGAHTPLINVGEEAIVSFLAPAEPGEYKYHCHVNTHEERGMHGILRVVASV